MIRTSDATSYTDLSNLGSFRSEVGILGLEVEGLRGEGA